MNDFEQYHKNLKFEHEMINRRLTWLLTSQTFLFAALAVSNEVPLGLKLAIPKLEIAISMFIWIAVVMSLTAKVILWKDYNRGKIYTRKVPFGVRNWITWTAFVPDFFMPLAFAAAWLLLIFC